MPTSSSRADPEPNAGVVALCWPAAEQFAPNPHGARNAILVAA